MGNYVERFIGSLNLNISSRNLATVLLTCKEDCDNFFANHWGKNDLVFDDLLDYRESKIEMADMSFDIFEETCNNKGIKKGFETTFLNYLSPHDVKFIESKIASKRITLNEIYTRFIKNPNQSVLKNML